MKQDSLNYLMSISLALFLFFIFRFLDTVVDWTAEEWVIFGFCMLFGWLFYTRLSILEKLNGGE